MRRTPLIVGACLLLATAACREPTQVTLELWTDVACAPKEFNNAAIAVGDNASLPQRSPSVTTSECLPSMRSADAGTLAIVPSGSKSAQFALRVVVGVGVDASECPAPDYVLDQDATANGIGCIVARRSLSFVPHASLRLPVGLLQGCLNVDCPEGETCVGGVCVDDDVDVDACQGPDGCPEIVGSGGAGAGGRGGAGGAGGAGGGTPVATQVVVSDDFSCALRSDGAWCWGIDTEGAWGTSATPSTTPTGPTRAMTSVADIAELAAGLEHMCARTSAGVVWCAGSDSNHQLGLPSTPSGTVPALVPLLGQAGTIRAGTFHTCASPAPMSTVGAPTCWGRNDSAQVIFPATTVPPYGVLPTPLPTPMLRAVVGGESHSCGIEGTDGAIMCWGNNNDYQCGDPMMLNTVPPVKVMDGQSIVVGATKVVAGQRHSCALTSQGDVLCWGSEDFAQQLGDGQSTSYTPFAQAVGVTQVAALSAGRKATCAVSGGQLRCWGAFGGSTGLTGTANTPSSLPVTIAGLPLVRDVAVGASHACALSDDGDVYCWGMENAGEVHGMGGTNVSFVYPPVHVALP